VVAFRQRDAGLNGRLYRCVEEAPAYSEHAVDGALRLISALGVPADGKRLSFALLESERRAAAERLAALGLDGRHPLIGLKIASFPTKAYRDWPVGHFVDLCRRIRADWPDAAFVIFGGPDEHESITAAQREIGGHCAAFSALSLREAGAVMSFLDAYVGVDTGPTHIMGAFDIPIVAMFHCKLPRSLYGPLEHPHDFSLDHPRLGQDCDETTVMAELSVDAVAGQLAAALGASRERAGAMSAR
jgi:heptosyltransferase-3